MFIILTKPGQISNEYWNMILSNINMKNIDVIFAIISGQLVGILVLDFLRHSTIEFAFYYALLILIFLPTLFVIGLYISHAIGKRILFIHQATKHVLVGAGATVIDLKIFEFLAWTVPNTLTSGSITLKGVSFLIATTLKYLGNKYWAFQKIERHAMFREITQFLMVMLVGLAIDVSCFYYFNEVLGPQFSITPLLWRKVSVLLSALIAAVWNFFGDKFLVFKK